MPKINSHSGNKNFLQHGINKKNNTEESFSLKIQKKSINTIQILPKPIKWELINLPSTLMLSLEPFS